MLFQIEESFVDIVREHPYKNVLTVMSTTPKILRDFYVRTPGNILPVAHYIYKLMIHIADSNLPFDVEPEVLAKVEVTERLTPEPVSYYYEYAHPDREGKMSFSGSYCWRDELSNVNEALLANNSDMIGEPLFIPLFRVPAQLLHSSNKKLNGDSTTDTTN